MVNESFLRLSSAQAHNRLQSLSALLKSCVDDGASIGFMQPFSIQQAADYWNEVCAAVAAGQRSLWIAEREEQVLGTVQLFLDWPPNQPHRAEVAKLMVHPLARREGIAQRLLALVENYARNCGRFVLTLDTVTGSKAENLYRKLGWQHVGEIPEYAYLPEGGLVSTTIFYKRLR